MPFAATWMDREVIILSEVSQTKANIMCHLYAESKKWILIYKTEIDKTNLQLPKGVVEGGVGEERQEFGVNRYMLLDIKEINNKDLLYSTGSYTQYFVESEMERNLKKNIKLNHFPIHLKLTPHCKLTMLQQ